MASGWAGSRSLPTPQRSEAAGCCRAGSGAAGCCGAICGDSTGATRGCCPGSGVSGGCRVASGWAGQRCLPGRAARGADRQGRPAQRRDAAARLPPRGGGALEPGLHQASAVIGRGGRPTPRSRTCICGRGWGRAQPEVWAGTLLRGSHIGRRLRSFRRAAIRWGGRGG